MYLVCRYRCLCIGISLLSNSMSNQTRHLVRLPYDKIVDWTVSMQDIYKMSLMFYFSGPAINNPSPQDRANMFLVHMAMVMEGAVKKWQCVLCGKMSKLKADILDHVEAKHMDNSFLYHCRYCSKVLNTNGNLRTHEVTSCNFIESGGSFSIKFLVINIWEIFQNVSLQKITAVIVLSISTGALRRWSCELQFIFRKYFYI